jgi:hypothetical protein
VVRAHPTVPAQARLSPSLVRVYLSYQNRAFHSAANLFSAALAAANALDSLKAELLDPDRQRLSRLRPEAVEYPEHCPRSSNSKVPALITAKPLMMRYLHIL